MRTNRILAVAIAAVVSLFAAPTWAGAQGFVSGNLGVAFGGDTPDDRPVTYGGSAGVFGRVIGFEADVAFTPDFFTDSNALDKNTVTTIMGNVLVGPSNGAFRPYAAGGVGLMRISIEGPLGIGDYDRNDFAMNVGGGVMLFPTPNFGLRGDVRYFRNLNNDEEAFGFVFEDFNYWRGTVGVVFRF